MTKIFFSGLILCLLLSTSACMVVPLNGGAFVHPYEQPPVYRSYDYYAPSHAYPDSYGYPAYYRHYSYPVVIYPPYVSFGMGPIFWNYGYSHGHMYWR